MDQILRGADSINSMTSSMRQSIKSLVNLTSPEQREQVSGFNSPEQREQVSGFNSPEQKEQVSGSKKEALEDGTNGENPFRKKWKVFFRYFKIIISNTTEKERKGRVGKRER